MKAKNYAHHITYKLDPLLRLEGLACQTKEVLLIKKVVQRDVHDLWRCQQNPKVLCLVRNEDEVKRLATRPHLLHVCSVGTQVPTSADQSTTTLILPTTGAGLQLHS